MASFSSSPLLFSLAVSEWIEMATLRSVFFEKVVRIYQLEAVSDEPGLIYYQLSENPWREKSLEGLEIDQT